MSDEIAVQFGFENAAEFFRMVAAADLSTPAKLSEFQRWQESDGTKTGLEKLCSV